ncbi:hypothetical protein HAX54_008280, partial [Datura stramonium]|nr:hypothetical protein [Datura stramonium]
RYTNVYKAKIMDPMGEELSRLSTLMDAFTSACMDRSVLASLISNNVVKNLVLGLPKTKFKDSGSAIPMFHMRLPLNLRR